MTRSFFGGDTRYSHFAVQVADPVGIHNAPFEERKAAKLVRREQEATLKGQGIKPTSYFQYRNEDEKGKAKQKAAAEFYAKQVENQTGVKMAIYEGFFM